MQKRLELAGMTIQLEDRVQCCHALQTKFWVKDPDQTLWELYVLHEDVEDDATPGTPAAHPPKAESAASWQHRMTEPFPSRIPHDDNSLVEVALRGTGNLASFGEQRDAILAESFRVLRPGGRVVMHVLTGDQPAAPTHPHLPGPAAVVERVPQQSEPVAAMQRAGFVRIHFDKLAPEPCFVVSGVRMRESLIAGIKPGHRPRSATHGAIYLGPLAQVVDDYGTTFKRGERVALNIHDWQQLAASQAADQFLLLPPESAAPRRCS